MVNLDKRISHKTLLLGTKAVLQFQICQRAIYAYNSKVSFESIFAILVFPKGHMTFKDHQRKEGQHIFAPSKCNAATHLLC